MTLSQNIQLKAQTVTSEDAFLASLYNLRLIEMGRIKDIYQDGQRAVVELCDSRKTNVGAEIISTGSFENTFHAAYAGQYCLVFFPANNFSLVDYTVDAADAYYSKSYAKCLPIGLASGKRKVVMDAEAEGVGVQGESYDFHFYSNEVVLNSDNISLRIDTDKGEAHLANAQGSILLNLSPSELNVQLGNTYDTQGTATTKVKLTADTQGSVKLETENHTLELTEDSLSITGNLKIDGDVEITGNLSAANGNFTAEK